MSLGDEIFCHPSCRIRDCLSLKTLQHSCVLFSMLASHAVQMKNVPPLFDVLTFPRAYQSCTDWFVSVRSVKMRNNATISPELISPTSQYLLDCQPSQNDFRSISWSSQDCRCLVFFFATLSAYLKTAAWAILFFHGFPFSSFILNMISKAWVYFKIIVRPSSEKNFFKNYQFEKWNEILRCYSQFLIEDF